MLRLFLSGTRVIEVAQAGWGVMIRFRTTRHGLHRFDGMGGMFYEGKQKCYASHKYGTACRCLRAHRAGWHPAC